MEGCETPRGCGCQGPRDAPGQILLLPSRHEDYGQVMKLGIDTCDGAWGIPMVSVLCCLVQVLGENAIGAVEDQDFAEMRSELTLPCSVKFLHVYAGFVCHPVC